MQILSQIYPKEDSKELNSNLSLIISKYSKQIKKKKGNSFMEKDNLLITYADTFNSPNKKNLTVLNNFIKKNAKEFSHLHILPFFPYSSDYGFSIKDYKKVSEKNGSWGEIKKISNEKKLMVDLVVNHVSKEHPWFKEFLKGNKKYRDYFVHFENKVDTSKVFRPRTSPLFTKFKTSFGERYVWTTFSSDQIDLNYSNPKVLFEMVDLLLFYVSKGAKLIRLDAIAYAWDKPNSSSVQLDKDHLIVRLFSKILNMVDPEVKLVVESNFPTKYNLPYLNEKEADLVYGFALPPLVAYAFFNKSSTKLQKYFRNESNTKNNKLFINFLASHDGIGILPLREFTSNKEFGKFVEGMKKQGGLVSYKSTKKGRSPYEINISYFDAINNPNKKNSEDEEVKKFTSAHAILLFSQGFPAIYIQSLIGSRNNPGYKKDGVKRTINRPRFSILKIEKELSVDGRRAKVLGGLNKMLKIKKKYKQFSPSAKQKVLRSKKELLVLQRSSNGKKVLVVVNFSDKNVILPKHKKKILLNGTNDKPNVINSYESCILEV